MIGVLGHAWLALGDLLGRTLRGLLGLSIMASLLTLVLAIWLIVKVILPSLPLPDTFWGHAADLGAGIGLVVLAILLSPAITFFVGALLFDIAAERVERRHFAKVALVRKINPLEAIANNLRIGLPNFLLALIALLFLFLPVFGFFVFLAINAVLAGREFFSLASLRQRDWQESRALRRRFWGQVNLAGLILAFFSLIPIIGALTPLLAAALMTRLSRSLRE